MLYCAVWYCCMSSLKHKTPLLYCTVPVLYCTVQCCTMQCCIVLCCTELCIPFCTCQCQYEWCMIFTDGGISLLCVLYLHEMKHYLMWCNTIVCTVCMHTVAVDIDHIMSVRYPPNTEFTTVCMWSEDVYAYTAQYSTVHTVQYSTVQYSTVQYRTVFPSSLFITSLHLHSMVLRVGVMLEIQVKLGGIANITAQHRETQIGRHSISHWNSTVLYCNHNTLLNIIPRTIE
jgi:hypothetical protein